MDPQFRRLGLAFRHIIQAVAPVRPNAPQTQTTEKPSDWAQNKFHFTPSAKQAEVLDGARST